MEGRDAEREKVVRRFRAYRVSGERRIRDELIHEHMWIAERCARRFANRGEPMDDLVQVALIGIMKAVERFDPELGHSFPAFATPTAMGELRRYFRDVTWAVRVPRRAKDLVGDLNATIGSLTQRLGRSPSVDEVARAMSVDIDVVLETMECAGVYRAESLDDAGPGDDRSMTKEHRLAGGDTDIADADLRLSASKMMSRLDERSRAIIVWRFYEGCTQATIGERLGIGQVQVSRLLRAALDQLRTAIAAVGGVGDDWVVVQQVERICEAQRRACPPPADEGAEPDEQPSEHQLGHHEHRLSHMCSDETP